MRNYLCGSLLVLALTASGAPAQAQATTEADTELAFMPKTMTVTLLNEGGKYVAIDLKHIPEGGTWRMDKDATMEQLKKDLGEKWDEVTRKKTS